MDYYCAICGKKIKDLDNMYIYYSTLFKEKVYICKECYGERFKKFMFFKLRRWYN